MSTTFSNADAEAKLKIVRAPGVPSVAVKPKPRRILPLLIVKGASLISLAWAVLLVWVIGNLLGIQ